jgi:hypothetical protein
MAIRSGSGGLKYPLPNQAQLVAQQSAAAASAGGSAAASTFGANRAFAANKMRVQADLANSAADRQYRAMAQLEGQNFEAQQNYYDRENRKGSQLEAQRFDAERQDKLFQQQTEAQWQNRYFTAEENRKDRDFTISRDKARADQEAEKIAEQDAQIEEDINSGVLELSPAAQRRLQELEAADAEAVIDQTMSDEQYKEFQKQQQEQIRRIRRTAGKPKGPDATQRANQQQTFFDPQTKTFHPDPGEEGSGRVPGTVNQNGQFQPTVEQPGTSKQDAEVQRWVDEKAKSYLEEGDEDGNPLYTPDQAFAKAREDSVPYFRARNGQQQPGGQPAPAPGQAEPPPPAPGQTGQQTTAAPQVPGAMPEPEVQTIVNDVRTAAKDMPLGEGETPEMRSFIEQNMEDIVRYQNVPLDQVPEKSRPAVDFYNRQVLSATQGQPIQLKTPDEAAMLPPDTPFVDSEGKQRRTPKKKGAA